MKRNKEMKIKRNTAKEYGGDMAKKYYLVTAKCGHVRKGNYIPVVFAVEAESGKEAAAIARQIPRVKHDHKDAILSLYEVSREEFEKQALINKHDPYLKATNRHDHETLSVLFEHRIQPETRMDKNKAANREVSNNTMHYGKERIRNPRKWLRMNEVA